MAERPQGNRYEFDPQQNAVFSRLADVMTFVAVAMIVPVLLTTAAAVFAGRSTLAGVVIVAPLPIAFAIMAAQLYQSANSFRRIVKTQGSDVSNLMAALVQMSRAYSVQRWLWIVISVAVILALATTIAGR